MSPTKWLLLVILVTLCAANAVAFAQDKPAPEGTFPAAWPKSNTQNVDQMAPTKDRYAYVLTAPRQVYDACSLATKTCSVMTVPVGTVTLVLPPNPGGWRLRPPATDEKIEIVPTGTTVGSVIAP